MIGGTPEWLALAIEILGIEDVEMLLRFFGVIREHQNRQAH